MPAGWSTNDSSSVTADWIPSVEIALESGVLTITGERYLQAEKSDENVVRRRTERGTGGVLPALHPARDGRRR